MRTERSVVRHSARAIIVDDAGHLVLIRRTRPGRARYWTTPGGHVEPEDRSVLAAMVREVREELGAEVGRAEQVFLVTDPVGEDGVRVQHFFVCRLESMDLSLRSGPEFVAPDGAYDVERVALSAAGAVPVELRPPALKAFLEANWVALLDAAGVSVRCGAGQG